MSIDNQNNEAELEVAPPSTRTAPTSAAAGIQREGGSVGVGTGQQVTAKKKPWAELLAATILIPGVILACVLMYRKADLGAVALVLFLTNTLTQACIDFFPPRTKPTFSAMARLIPAVAAIATYYFR